MKKNKQLAANIKLRYSDCKNALDDAAIRRRKGKAKVEGDERRCKTASQENCLTTLDIFAGCGGLSEGLQQSGNVHVHVLVHVIPDKRNVFE